MFSHFRPLPPPSIYSRRIIPTSLPIKCLSSLRWISTWLAISSSTFNSLALGLLTVRTSSSKFALWSSPFVTATLLSSILDQLQTSSVHTAPYALSTIDKHECSWVFRYPEQKATLSSAGDQQVIRLIAVLHSINFTGPRPHMTVYPLYDNDAVVAHRSLHSEREFDPALHLGVYRPLPCCVRGLTSRSP